jgi:AcrR family transcriptional regulator
MSDANRLRAVAAQGAPAQDRKQLQRFDWLQRALQIFVAEGIDAVRITRLADDLGVTRGSFYWHFANRGDLIDALVRFWQDKNTAAIEQLVVQAQSLADGIFRYFETCLDAERFDSRLDLAVREWARRSTRIRELLDREDSARIEALRQFFTRFEYSMPEALIRARVLYYSQIGFYALETREPLTTRLSYTEAYFECFTGNKLDPALSQAFCQRILKSYAELPQ